ncbi:hypothetical protein [Dokdonella sp.]|uniref:hypothetical protein n=1 Tax=Dokdonella sp. TaxID=2291710 RepID=UPI00352957B9
MKHFLIGLGLGLACSLALASKPDDSDALQKSVEQLRESIGLWDVVTENLAEDGSVANTMKGTYRFSWVVPDRVVSGRMDIPEKNQAAGILFYVNERKALIEMVSVGADGNLWIMSGPLGGEVRTTPEFETRDGGTGQLRFTRFNVGEDRFESRMEYSKDGGKTWTPGNHQIFRRAQAAGS